jgi:hypothetical protein
VGTTELPQLHLQPRSRLKPEMERRKGRSEQQPKPKPKPKQQPKPQQQQQAPNQQKQKQGWSLSDIATNLVTLAILGYSFVVGRNIYGIFQPEFPDTYTNGQPMPKYKNAIEPGTLLHARVWAGPAVPTAANRRPQPSEPPDWEFDFPYGYAHGFESQSKTMPVTIPDGLLQRRSNAHIYAEVTLLSETGDYEQARVFASAKGDFIKYTKPPARLPKYTLLSGEVRTPCPARRGAIGFLLMAPFLASCCRAIRSARSTWKTPTAHDRR